MNKIDIASQLLVQQFFKQSISTVVYASLKSLFKQSSSEYTIILISIIKRIINKSYFNFQPSNIFFSNEGVIKIGDFGLVTALSDEVTAERGAVNNKFSRHTSEVGTKLYMGPELVSIY